MTVMKGTSVGFSTVIAPRGRCQGCGAFVLLIRDGRCGLHVAYAGRCFVVMCPGGGHEPVAD